MTAERAPRLVLHTYFRSSCSWRVRIALGHKRLAYEPVFVHLLKGGQLEEAYRAKNALGQVPLLEIFEAIPRPAVNDDAMRYRARDAEPSTRVAQSLAILEYLEERFPERPLLPRDLALRARARQLAEAVNSGIQPFQNLTTLRHVKSLGADEQAFARHFVGRGLDALEREVAARPGPFLVGDAPSFADVCLVPQLFGARRFGLDVAAWPALARAEAACLALEDWKAAHPDAQPDRE